MYRNRSSSKIELDKQLAHCVLAMLTVCLPPSKEYITNLRIRTLTPHTLEIAGVPSHHTQSVLQLLAIHSKSFISAENRSESPFANNSLSSIVDITLLETQKEHCLDEEFYCWLLEWLFGVSPTKHEKRKVPVEVIEQFAKLRGLKYEFPKFEKKFQTWRDGIMKQAKQPARYQSDHWAKIHEGWRDEYRAR